jgi:hypothetical protein
LQRLPRGVSRIVGGDTYRADAGFARTAIRSDAGFAVDNLDLVGVFAESGIVEDEVRAGLFDGAEIRVSFVSWGHLAVCAPEHAMSASLRPRWQAKQSPPSWPSCPMDCLRHRPCWPMATRKPRWASSF